MLNNLRKWSKNVPFWMSSVFFGLSVRGKKQTFIYNIYIIYRMVRTITHSITH